MRYLDYLLHLFTPRHSNGHRARLLHPQIISVYIALLILFQLSVSGLSHWQPQVLGYASNISVGDLLNDTNAKRVAAGLPALRIDSELTSAAAAKGADMFANQYWAHVSPQGVDPWHWITASGYNYLFAGENLARDFADSQAVVDAWMNSPSHRENLLNSHYEDVGFAVVNGKYGSDETTLVVQEFGKRANSAPTVEAAPVAKPAAQPEQPSPQPQPAAVESSPAAQEASPAAKAAPPPAPVPTPPSNSHGAGVVLNTESSYQPKIDLGALTKGVTLALTLFLVALLAVDSILVYKRHTVRVSGHNFAHLLILLALVIAINVVGRGLVV